MVKLRLAMAVVSLVCGCLALAFSAGTAIRLTRPVSPPKFCFLEQVAIVDGFYQGQYARVLDLVQNPLRGNTYIVELERLPAEYDSSQNRFQSVSEADLQSLKDVL